MPDLDELLNRLEELLTQLQELDDEIQQPVFELLDGFDALHRLALTPLAHELGNQTLERLRQADPAIAWLLDAYGVGVDQSTAADVALEKIRPYIQSHGGKVEVLGAQDGVVSLRLSGACSGCSASAETLRDGVEEALREGFLGYARMEVEEDDAPSHPPPSGPLLLQIGPRPG